MRMRKKTWAQPFLEEHRDFVLYDPKDWKGQWKQRLQVNALQVEIGCGKGDYFIQMAHQYPKEGWIALERDTSCIAVAAKKALQDPLPTQRMIEGDAQDLQLWFEEGEIDTIFLNFSDPWPKKKNTKRRLTSSSFVENYQRLLAPNGTIKMKTDNADLFAFSLVAFSQQGWILEECSLDYRKQDHPEDAKTEYEVKFMEEGKPIYRGVFTRK